MNSSKAEASPARGRIRQHDPALFAYVGADPVNFIDPLGLEDEPPPIVVTGSHCPSGWTCYDPGFGYQSLWRPVEGVSGGEVVVTGGRPRWSPKTIIIRAAVSGLEQLAELVKPPDGRRKDETYFDCMSRIVSPEDAAVGAAAAELGRGNPALYPHGAPAGASGTSYISTTIRAIEKALGGGGLGSRGRYWFGAKTLGGAIGRGVSSASVATGVAVVSLEIGKAGGAA